MSSVRDFAKKVQAKFPAIHVLINNGEITELSWINLRVFRWKFCSWRHGDPLQRDQRRFRVTNGDKSHGPLPADTFAVAADHRGVEEQRWEECENCECLVVRTSGYGHWLWGFSLQVRGKVDESCGKGDDLTSLPGSSTMLAMPTLKANSLKSTSPSIFRSFSKKENWTFKCTLATLESSTLISSSTQATLTFPGSKTSSTKWVCEWSIVCFIGIPETRSVLHSNLSSLNILL
jgi:hypothetical protein